MRDLVASRSVVGVLVGLYVLATLGMIPVPSLVLSATAPADEIHASYCACVSCSPTNCCCAMQAPPADDAGVTMLGYNCQPKVSWFLAVLPPAVPVAETIPSVCSWPGGESAAANAMPIERPIGVPTPPPKRAA